MERLTTEDLELKGCHGCEEKGICYARYWCSGKKKALIQLKRYEDTGLTPEQIREIDLLYAEKCQEVAKLQQRDTAKEPQYEGDSYHEGRLVYDTWICPNCGKRYEVDYDDYDFCPKCGQRLKWEKNDG